VLELPSLKDRGFVLHPVHRAAGAADRRIAGQARWDAAAGQLTVPARSAVAWVIE
jgi:pullulanase